MQTRIVPHRRLLAIEDIAGHSSHIAESNLEAALRFLNAIESTVELLCQFPEAGGMAPTTHPEAQGLRVKLVAGSGNYMIL
jgi:plasmid stabilization system protein ParE